MRDFTVKVLRKAKISETVDCPCCKNSMRKRTKTDIYHVSDKDNENAAFDYYKCTECGSIFIEPNVIDTLDGGGVLVHYESTYWDDEYKSAIKRCYGEGLARMAEAFFYCKIKIENFLDIGAGSGKLLDAIEAYLPDSSHHFYAIERFPPEWAKCSHSCNFMRGNYEKILKRKYQCGLCMEVVEHLTPKMLIDIFSIIANASDFGAFYLLNSGFVPYVEQENNKYLNPFITGHIVSYSAKALHLLLSPLGFNVILIPGKNWLIGIEYVGKENVLPSISTENITDRIWSALPENMDLLIDKKMGSVLKILGRESARAYR